MSLKTADIKCAKCNVALQSPTDPKPDSRIACPTCGEGDTYDQVMREVSEHVTEQAGDFLTGKISADLRRNKNIKITKHAVPKKPHRFIVNLDLH